MSKDAGGKERYTERRCRDLNPHKTHAPNPTPEPMPSARLQLHGCILDGLDAKTPSGKHRTLKASMPLLRQANPMKILPEPDKAAGVTVYRAPCSATRSGRHR